MARLSVIVRICAFWFSVFLCCYESRSETRHYTPHFALEQIDTIFTSRKEYLRQSMENRLIVGDVYGLYNIQAYTNNLLVQSDLTGRSEIIDSLASILLSSIPYLTQRNNTRYWACGTAAKACSISTRHGKEVLLASAQFVHLLSRTLIAISRIPESKRTTTMLEFSRQFAPLIVNDHLMQWIFGSDPDRLVSVRGWGCSDASTHNLDIHVQKLLVRSLGDSPSYCNALTDDRLWVFSSAANMLAANHLDPTLVPMIPDTKRALSSFLMRAAIVFHDRISQSLVTDFSGNIVEGVNFDIGIWDTHPDYAYSGFAGDSLVYNQSAERARNVAWDIGHASRFVHILESFRIFENATGLTLTEPGLTRKFANQFFYGAFNKNFHFPRFTNYMDGKADGWYRSTWPPGTLSYAALTGGYGFWVEEEPDGNKVFLAMQELLRSKDPDRISFLLRYYTGGYQSAAAADLFRLMYLPSLTLPSPQGFLAILPIEQGKNRVTVEYDMSSPLPMKNIELTMQFSVQDGLSRKTALSSNIRPLAETLQQSSGETVIDMPALDGQAGTLVGLTRIDGTDVWGEKKNIVEMESVLCSIRRYTYSKAESLRALSRITGQIEERGQSSKMVMNVKLLITPLPERISSCAYRESCPQRNGNVRYRQIGRELQKMRAVLGRYSAIRKPIGELNVLIDEFARLARGARVCDQ